MHERAFTRKEEEKVKRKMRRAAPGELPLIEREMGAVEDISALLGIGQRHVPYEGGDAEYVRGRHTEDEPTELTRIFI